MSVDSMAILILLGSFFVMVLLRFPIAYAVALSSVFCLLYQGLPLTTICQQMVKGISSFSLMAVPFFITMGCLMGSGGDFGEADCTGQFLCRMDAGRYGNGKYCGILFLRRHFRFRGGGHGFSWNDSDSYDGGSGI